MTRPARRAWLQAALAALAAASARAAAAPTAAGMGPATPAPAAAQPAAAPGSAAPAADDDDRIRPQRVLRFPRDHGAHPGARTEWWYATGWLQAAVGGAGGAGTALFGFQLTFFRSRTALAAALPGRFAPRQLLFAHAALSDIAGQRHRHAQRISRWSGDEALPDAHAIRADTDVALGRWHLRRQGGRYAALLAAPEAGFTLDLQLTPSQPLLLQGAAGYSRKGPLPQQASHYYSLPQLAVAGQITQDGRRQALQGRGWLDHEWSDEYLADGAVGWDWIGINLADGTALTAFVLRRAEGDARGSVVWAGGSHRTAGGALRAYAPDEVSFSALRSWSSPATGARWPVHWRIHTPLGRFELRALLDAQELDSRASAGTVYWEGLAELLAPDGMRLGLGYLEMTGRAQPLKLGT